jgi:hypothetical protein
MKITLFDLQVLLAALEGSLRFVDKTDGTPFTYIRKTRHAVFEKIINEMNNTNLNIEIKE